MKSKISWNCEYMYIVVYNIFNVVIWVNLVLAIYFVCISTVHSISSSWMILNLCTSWDKGKTFESLNCFMLIIFVFIAVKQLFCLSCHFFVIAAGQYFVWSLPYHHALFFFAGLDSIQSTMHFQYLNSSSMLTLLIFFIYVKTLGICCFKGSRQRFGMDSCSTPIT